MRAWYEDISGGALAFLQICSTKRHRLYIGRSDGKAWSGHITSIHRTGKHQPLFYYFKQMLAQVTNPPIVVLTAAQTDTKALWAAPIFSEHNTKGCA